MLKILSSQQTNALDDFTIRHTPIASINLMEAACRAFVEWYTQRFDPAQKVGIVCGTGNNGGDGLGIARILQQASYRVNVWVVHGAAKETEDFKKNLDRLKGKVIPADFTVASAIDVFSGCDILLDAILGSGLSRPVEGIYRQAIQSINSSPAIRVAVDIPSGLFADKHSEGDIVKADYTVSFQLPKLSFMFPENHQYVGAWEVVDIGLSKSFVGEAKSDNYYITKKSIKAILKQRSAFAHKGDFGRALLIAGSYGKMGACVLAARAALRSGIGLLTLHVPKVGYPIVQSAVPEAMVSVDTHSEIFSVAPSFNAFNVIGIGPGLGQAEETFPALVKVLGSGKPIVIDADALNMIGSHKALHLIPAGSILTPHPKEFERLVGRWKDDFERLERQIRLAKEMKCIVILKGGCTSITTPEGLTYFNSSGNPGMATGGSGDVLTGILTGLLAQKYSAEETAIVGVYLHGLSGDIATREKGMNSLIASDLIDFLPAAFKDIY